MLTTPAGGGWRTPAAVSQEISRMMLFQRRLWCPAEQLTGGCVHVQVSSDACVASHKATRQLQFQPQAMSALLTFTPAAVAVRASPFQRGAAKVCPSPRAPPGMGGVVESNTPHSAYRVCLSGVSFQNGFLPLTYFPPCRLDAVPTPARCSLLAVQRCRAFLASSSSTTSRCSTGWLTLPKQGAVRFRKSTGY